jgi:hypothetical protein
MVCAIKYVNGKILCELVCVVGGLVCRVGGLCEWVWGMVKTIFFRLGKCSESFVNASFLSGSTGMSIA